MALFTETQNVYYQILYRLLTHGAPVTKKDFEEVIATCGFEETSFFLLDCLQSNHWQLFTQKDGLFYSKIGSDLQIPLSNLQVRFLKTILEDPRIHLFLQAEEITSLSEKLAGVSPLFSQKDFYYTDQFEQGDSFEQEEYQEIFRRILEAIHTKEYLLLSYLSPKKGLVNHRIVPVKLEYSIKNDCFRLLALNSCHRPSGFLTIRISRIVSCQNTQTYASSQKLHKTVNRYLRNDYYKEPVTILIYNKRNALERAMLQFANYKKNTCKLAEGLYQCEIFYPKSDETELLIEILSFGPMIKVLGNQGFLKQLKDRLKKQRSIQQW